MTNPEAVENCEDPEDLPDWLGKSILSNELPWEAAQTYKVQEFLEKYTLHDSSWVTIHHEVAYDNHAILVLEWDAVWLPDEIAQSTSMVSEWPLLFIKIEGIKQISILGYKDIGGITRGIALAEVEEIDNKKVFVIHDHFGGSVEIVFDGSSNFLALDRDKKALKI